MPRNCAEDSWFRLQARAPFAIAGKVVANSAVGFGEPDMVTVEALAMADVALVAVCPCARMVKRGETPYMTPCVELRKSR